MIKTGTVLAALFLAVGATVAQTYDDPAVLSCEELAKSVMAERGRYIRRSADINGSSVTIKYQVQIMTAEPEGKQIVCRFKLNEKTRYFNYDGPATEAARSKAVAIMMRTGLYPILDSKTALR